MKVDLTPVKSLIIFATPLASKPKDIIAIGPIPARSVVKYTTNCFVPSLKLSKRFNNLPKNSITGVNAFRNCSPIGTIAVLRSCTCFLNLYIGDSEILFNSRSDNIASSSTVAVVNSATVCA